MFPVPEGFPCYSVRWQLLVLNAVRTFPGARWLCRESDSGSLGSSLALTRHRKSWKACALGPGRAVGAGMAGPGHWKMSGAYWAVPHPSQDWPEVPLDRKEVAGLAGPVFGPCSATPGLMDLSSSCGGGSPSGTVPSQCSLDPFPSLSPLRASCPRDLFQEGSGWRHLRFQVPRESWGESWVSSALGVSDDAWSLQGAGGLGGPESLAAPSSPCTVHSVPPPLDSDQESWPELAFLLVSPSLRRRAHRGNGLCSPVSLWAPCPRHKLSLCSNAGDFPKS